MISTIVLEALINSVIGIDAEFQRKLSGTAGLITLSGGILLS
jgi:hypothetical protein